MKIKRYTSSYDASRYGRPWIAKVTSTGNKLKLEYGTWIGDKGEEGILILDDIEPGEYFARGHDDRQQPRNSKPSYYLLSEGGMGIETTKLYICKALGKRI